MKTALLLIVLATASCANALEVKVTGSGAAAWSAPVVGLGVGAYKLFSYLFDVNRILSAAGKEAAILALQNIPAPENAMVAKDTLIACNVILFWIPANSQQTADAVNAFITNEFSKISPALVIWLQTVAATVERYIPLGSVVLDNIPHAAEYLMSFIGGMQQGIIAWQANPTVSVKVKYTTEKQRAHEIKKMKFAKSPIGWFTPVDGCECKP